MSRYFENQLTADDLKDLEDQYTIFPVIFLTLKDATSYFGDGSFCTRYGFNHYQLLVNRKQYIVAKAEEEKTELEKNKTSFQGAGFPFRIEKNVANSPIRKSEELMKYISMFRVGEKHYNVTSREFEFKNSFDTNGDNELDYFMINEVLYYIDDNQKVKVVEFGYGC